MTQRTQTRLDFGSAGNWNAIEARARQFATCRDDAPCLSDWIVHLQYIAARRPVRSAGDAAMLNAQAQFSPGRT